jgi:hypothetical protein
MLRIFDIDKLKTVAPQMRWQDAATSQIDEFEKAIAAFATRFPATAEVVGSHCSKSIDLPVVKLSTDVGEFTLRDNFHDINLMAIFRSPSTLSLKQLFADIQEPLTWEWHLAEIDRCRGYSWREWSDEEMNILVQSRLVERRAHLGWRLRSRCETVPTGLRLCRGHRYYDVQSEVHEGCQRFHHRHKHSHFGYRDNRKIPRQI